MSFLNLPKERTPMIDVERWTDEWVASWNRDDLEKLVSLYAENVELRAPFAKIYAESGAVKGKAALRRYWEEYKRRMPNVTLQKVAVYTGHLALALHCVDSKGRHGIRTVLFDQHDKAISETTCIDRVR
jgi:ketosteroid isomerase-like protein